MSRSPEYADLHIHSNLSDGFYSPPEIIKKAAANKQAIISFTEHNVFHSPSQIEELKDIGRQNNVGLVEGIEISANFKGVSLHLLGFSEAFKPSFTLQSQLNETMQHYQKRGLKILSLLKNDGYDISPDEIKQTGALYPHRNIIAYLAHQKYGGKLSDWYKYKADEENFFKEAPAVIEMIHDSGGVAVLAHPGSTVRSEEIADPRTLIEELFEVGLDGIEGYHIGNRDKQIVAIIGHFVNRENMIVTGGSDFHGEIYYPTDIGEYGVSKTEYDVLSSSLHKLAKY